MSISRQSQQGPIDSYANTKVIHHRGKRELVLGGGTGVDLDPSGVDNGLWYDATPANGDFDSNTQVAELVAFRRHSVLGRTVEINFQGATPGSWIMEFQTTGQPDMWGQTIGPGIDQSTNPSFADLDDEYQGVRNFIKEWPAHIMESAISGYTAFNNSTTSAGGGGQNDTHGHSMVNFRENFGQGPIYMDPENQKAIRCQGVINWSQIDGQTLEGKVIDTSYWDIHELEEPKDQLKLRDV